MANLLDIQLFRMPGRRSVLTPAGEVLCRRARVLLAEAGRLEGVAGALARGQESELRLAVEIIFPTWRLLEAMHRFGEIFPDTRIQLHESALSGTEELLHEDRVDLAIGSRVPRGFAGDPVLDVRFVCCAAPDHPLHRLDRTLTLEDPKQHRHLVVRDSGTQGSRRVLALEPEQRWTVSHKATSIRTACMGIGFAGFAESNIRDELARDELRPLPLAEGGVRQGTRYLMHADRDAAGPGQVKFCSLLREMISGGHTDPA